MSSSKILWLTARHSLQRVVPGIYSKNASMHTHVVPSTNGHIHTHVVPGSSASIHTQACPLMFQTTDINYGVPIKTKGITSVRMETAKQANRKKKVERLIKNIIKFKHKHNVNEYKDCPEFEVNVNLKRNKERKRPREKVTAAERLQQDDISKRFAYNCWSMDLNNYRAIQMARARKQEALQELRLESEELYQQAVQFVDHLDTFRHEAIKETPPIRNYDQDGEYEDHSKVW